MAWPMVVALSAAIERKNGIWLSTAQATAHNGFSPDGMTLKMC